MTYEIATERNIVHVIDTDWLIANKYDKEEDWQKVKDRLRGAQAMGTLTGVVPLDNRELEETFHLLWDVAHERQHMAWQKRMRALIQAA